MNDRLMFENNRGCPYSIFSGVADEDGYGGMLLVFLVFNRAMG
jgi:hypothetical protein